MKELFNLPNYLAGLSVMNKLLNEYNKSDQLSEARSLGLF